MIYVEKLIHHPLYKSYLEKLEALEKNRIYCKHSFEHFLDVARIGILIAYEEEMSLDKEAFYLAALLHDLGRVEEYQNKRSHEGAGYDIAKNLLTLIHYPENEQGYILEAISNHRLKDQETNNFSGFLAKADKLSRNCFYCKASDSCYWSSKKKNQTIKY